MAYGRVKWARARRESGPSRSAGAARRYFSTFSIRFRSARANENKKTFDDAFVQRRLHAKDLFISAGTLSLYFPFASCASRAPLPDRITQLNLTFLAHLSQEKLSTFLRFLFFRRESQHTRSTSRSYYFFRTLAFLPRHFHQLMSRYRCTIYSFHQNIYNCFPYSIARTKSRIFF